VVTFAELDSAVGRFAGFLRSRGLAPGDRVAIFLENSPQFAIAYYGTLRAGGIAVCLNPMHKAVELVHEFEDSGARALVTTNEAYSAVEPIRAQTKLETVVLTDYRDFLPDEPALPLPPSFLEAKGGAQPSGPPRSCAGQGRGARSLVTACVPSVLNCGGCRGQFSPDQGIRSDFAAALLLRGRSHTTFITTPPR